MQLPFHDILICFLCCRVFSDIINSLQGVFIFIVAVCNKDNLKKVKQLLLRVFPSLCVKASASRLPHSSSPAQAFLRKNSLPMTERQQLSE